MKKKWLFWITGLSGSGKTQLAKKIKKDIEKINGPTLEISGDDLRKYFSLNKYDEKSRRNYAKKYSHFCNFLINKGFNVIFSTVSLFHEVQSFNRKKISNYMEIFIKSDINQLIKKKNKFFYKKKNSKIVGKNIKAEYPKKPHIVIKNNFQKPINLIKEELLIKIKKKLNYLN